MRVSVCSCTSVALPWDATTGWSVEQRSAVIEPLLDAGCRYAVCGGRDGRTAKLSRAPCEDVCVATSSRPEVVDRLHLQRSILREWTYERIHD